MKKTILIVDDQMEIVTPLIQRCESEGYEVRHAHNGKDGLEVAKNYHPDIILVDVAMPIMDGVSFIKELRKDDWGKSAKAIILSNLSDSAHMIESEKHGVNDYLIKSDWSLKDLLDVIKKRLEE